MDEPRKDNVLTFPVPKLQREELEVVPQEIDLDKAREAVVQSLNAGDTTGFITVILKEDGSFDIASTYYSEFETMGILEFAKHTIATMSEQ